MPTSAFSETDLTVAADLLSAMANEKLILDIVSREVMSVGSLAVMVNLSQSALSQHLGRLKGALLVTTRRDAQTIYYSGETVAVRRLLDTLYEICSLATPVTQVVAELEHSEQVEARSPQDLHEECHGHHRD